MNWKSCKYLLAADLQRVQSDCGYIAGIKTYLKNTPFRVVFWFRLGSYLKEKRDILSKVLYGVSVFILKRCKNKTGIQLNVGTVIGPGLRFPHFSCIVINHEAVLGKNCTIFQGVTIGKIKGPKGGVPIIGDNVVISSGAKVIGNIKVGNNVMIGANAVVNKDVPDGAVVVGVPGKVVNYNGKENVVLYIGDSF